MRKGTDSGGRRRRNQQDLGHQLWEVREGQAYSSSSPWDSFAPRAHLATSRDSFGCHNLGGHAAGICGLRDAADPPTMHRAPLQLPHWQHRILQPQTSMVQRPRNWPAVTGRLPIGQFLSLTKLLQRWFCPHWTDGDTGPGEVSPPDGQLLR